MSVPVELVVQVPRFASLAFRTQAALASAMQEIRVRSGQILLYEGDHEYGLFVVLEGRIRLVRTANDGREQVLDVAEIGDLFNVVPLVDAGPAPATARAMKATRCLHLPIHALWELLADHADLSLVLLRDLASQVRDLAVLLEDLAFRTVRERLARILLAEATDGTADVTHQDLAARAGTIREIAGRTLRQLADEGLIELSRGHIRVLDVAGLRQIVADDFP
jgi:CRP/FNR family transcriptional regulator